MRLTNTLSTLIIEQSRFQVLYDKWVKPSDRPRRPGETPKGAMAFETLKNIIFGDPTTTVPQDLDKESATIEDMSKIHVGKYVQWMLKNFAQPKSEYEIGTPEYKREAQEYRRLFIEDIDKLMIDLLKFERFKGRLPVRERDINKHTPQTLSLAVDEFKLAKDSKSSKEERLTKENPYKFEGSTIELVTPNWTIVKIEDKGKLGDAAADYFGGYYDIRDEFDETNWCTSNVGGSYFYTYIKDGPLYVILPNNATEFGKKTGLPKERYQFHFPSNQYMNRRDRQIDLVEFLNNKGEELKDYFKPQFAKGLVKGGTSDVVDIAYPENAAGKFIALYGFEELFESLPDNITRLLISNKSDQNIALDVPESIGRFKNLEALKLEKICRSIPDSVCDLKLLNFLALPNNKDLKSLPECLMNLTDLAFINLKDSNPNIEIPPKLKERLSDEGMGFYYFD